MGADSPDVVIAKRLLDQLKQRGFQFERIAPGEDGPLIGNRMTGNCVDMIHIVGSVATVSPGVSGVHR